MADKTEKRAALAEKRARVLALMFLTRRGDLRVEEADDDIGVDFVVRFRTSGKEGLREFGVEPQGAWIANDKEQADKTLSRSMRQVISSGPSLRPICLFLFAMQDDHAWYTWVAEPVVAKDGQPSLRMLPRADCRSLDKRSLDEIIERADAWYDAMYPTVFANGTPGVKR